MAIANNFITERNNSEVIAVGLNAIREISSRCPLSMSEDLLGDLVLYRTYKDKGVTTAAKSLIQLFRDRNPLMLQKKMRGKPTEASIAEATKVRQYGEIDAKGFVPGAEIVALEEENRKRKRDEDDDGDDDSDEEKGEWEEASEEEESDEDEEIVIKNKKNRSKKRKLSEEDEDDSGDEWVDVSSESGDEKEVKEGEIQTNQLTLEEKEEKAAKISTEKILTQEDFKKIRIEQLKKKITDKNFVKNNKKKTISIETDSEEEEKMAKRFVVWLSFFVLAKET
jgi:protein SDA1